jgi:hypothetical protein
VTDPPSEQPQHIVAMLELLLGAEEITAIDLGSELVGTRSGTTRRIGWVATARVGSTVLRILAEQRSGSRPQGASWVESVAAKRRDLGCDVGLAVSASGFTGAASAIATDLRVRLRTVTSRDPEYIADNVYHGLGAVQVLDDLVMDVRPVVQEAAEGVGEGPVQLVYADTDITVPQTDILHLTWRAWPEHGVATPTSAALEVALRNPRPDGTAFELLTSNGRFSPEALYVHIQVSFARREWIVSNAWEYASPDGSAYVVFDAQAPGDSRSVRMVGQTRGVEAIGDSDVMIVTRSSGNKQLSVRSLVGVAASYDGDTRAFQGLDSESSRSLAFAAELARNRGSAQLFSLGLDPSSRHQLRFKQP